MATPKALPKKVHSKAVHAQPLQKDSHAKENWHHCNATAALPVKRKKHSAFRTLLDAHDTRDKMRIP